MSSLKPATNYTSCSLQEPVKLRATEESLTQYKPVTIPQFFHECCEKFRDLPALTFEVPGEENDSSTKNSTWTTITYGEYKNHVEQAALALLHLGVPARSSVSILAFNCPEWFYIQMAAFRINAVSAGIYVTNSPEAVYHILETSDASVVVVDDTQQLEKVRAIKSRLPKLLAVVQLHGPYDFTEDERNNGFYRWCDLVAMEFDDAARDELARRESVVAVNDCCLLIYTSGTVGMPKGCMITHDGILYCARAVSASIPLVDPGYESVVSFLPLNHIAGQLFDIMIGMVNGCLVHFADRNALKGTLNRTFHKARPTFVTGVPRIFEKIYEKLTETEENSSGVMKWIQSTARSTMLQYQIDRAEGKSPSYLKYWLASQVTNRIKMALGFENAKMCLIGGAPVSEELKHFFLSMDLPLVEAYGMSEASGAFIFNFNKPHLKTSGTSVAEMEVKIREPNANGEGEIILRGRCTMMGYLKDPEKTKSTITDDGWLLTGDLGYIDNDDYVFICGRIKELIITAGGENIPPVHIEETIKKELPCISNAVVIGDHRKYLTVLLTFKTYIDLNTGYPLDTLLPETTEWLESLDLQYTNLTEILNINLPDNLENYDPDSIEVKLDDKVKTALEKGLKKANHQAISNAQKVQYFTVLPHDFSVPTTELGPTLKVRRNIVHSKYAKTIEKMYKK